MTPRKLEMEQTEQGHQVLVPGVRPVTVKDRLQMLADAPLTSTKEQKPPTIGLFDEDSRNQFDFFTHCQRKER